jgi:hypothetical protein
MMVEAALALLGKFLLEFYREIAQVFYGTILWPISSMGNLILTGILWFILVFLILRIRRDRRFRLE